VLALTLEQMRTGFGCGIASPSVFAPIKRVENAECDLTVHEKSVFTDF